MDYQRIRYDVTDGVATITLNYPGNLNAIDEPMCQELDAAITAGLADSAVKLFLLQAAGRAFSSGGDLNYFQQTIAAGGNIDNLIRMVGALALKLKQMPKLLITAVAGAAAGAGANLALAGDLIVAAENAKFIQAFVNIAAVPDAGGSYLLSRSLGFHKAMELCLTGRPLKAAEAQQLGLVYQVVPAEELASAATALARQLTQGPLLAYSNIKKQMFAAYFADYEQYLQEVEFPTQSQCAQSDDFAEGVGAFLAKRSPQFQGK